SRRGKIDEATRRRNPPACFAFSPCHRVTFVSFLPLTVRILMRYKRRRLSGSRPRWHAASRNRRRPRQGVGRVKKTLASLAGLTLLGGFVVWAGWAGAQPPQQPIRQTNATSTAPTPAAPASAQRPGTAVAVVNMNAVLKNYQKAQQLNTQIKNKVQ